MTIARTLLATILLSASALCFGQSYNRAMSITIPFAFQAAGKTLPAGHYRVSEMNAYGLISVRDDASKHVILVQTNNANHTSSPAEHSKMSFLRTGAEYRLQQVTYAGSSAQLKVWPSRKAEREFPGGLASQVRTLVADFDRFDH